MTKPTKKASRADREHFSKIAKANAGLDDDPVPQSLDEMFDRLDRMRRQLGELAEPGIVGADDGDLAGHLNYIARQRDVRKRGSNSA